VEQRYTVTAFVLEDGTAVSGLIVAETPGSVTVRMAGGAELVIRRGELDESQQLTTSIIPVGLEAVISLQECADLLAALRER
jgi:putative heme-binding domain-containing protein